MSDLLTLGLIATQLPVIAAGVMVSASEYSAGGVRSTFLAAPRRVHVLAAQAVVASMTAALSAVTALGVTFLVLQPFRSDLSPVFEPLAPETVRMLAGFTLYLLTAALLSAALGSLTRSTTAGLVTALGVMFLLQQALPLVGGSRLLAALPGWAGILVAKSDVAASAGAAQVDVPLTPWQGYAILAAWALILLICALVRLRRSPL